MTEIKEDIKAIVNESTRVTKQTSSLTLGRDEEDVDRDSSHVEEFLRFLTEKKGIPDVSDRLRRKTKEELRALYNECRQQHCSHLVIRLSPKASSGGGPSGGGAENSTSGGGGEAPRDGADGEWREASTANGRRYYYNTSTRETRWKNPNV